MMNVRARQVFIPKSRLIPVDTVNRLRHDAAWSEAVYHLEQGLLGLGIRYTEERMAKTEEIDNAIKEELSELRSQVRQLRSKISAENILLEANVKHEVNEIGAKVSQLKEDVESMPKEKADKPVKKPSNKTSIQVSREFKHLLKGMKGSRSYEELIREKMCV